MHGPYDQSSSSPHDPDTRLVDLRLYTLPRSTLSAKDWLICFSFLRSYRALIELTILRHLLKKVEALDRTIWHLTRTL
jgi:hypothetical protein